MPFLNLPVGLNQLCVVHLIPKGMAVRGGQVVDAATDRLRLGILLVTRRPPRLSLLSASGLRQDTDLADPSAVHLLDLEHRVLYEHSVAHLREMAERAEQQPPNRSIARLVQLET